MRSEAVSGERRFRPTPLSSPLTPLRVIAALAAITLAACGTAPPRATPGPTARAPEAKPAPKPAPAQPPATGPRGGGYYLNDGPGDNPPPNLEQVPDAVPRPEALHRGAMRPYVVMGQSYAPMSALQPYSARGVASWYGRRYHGKQTSSGEIYDMYGMTAAHPILPLPSYARVTNLQNGKSIVVRVNDRGPFLSSRLIDLSYTAAYKLGVLGGGSTPVEVETIIPDAGTPTAPVYAMNKPPARPAAPATIAGGALAPPEPSATTGEDPIIALLARADPSAIEPVVPMVSDRKGFFLQLGAFGSSGNAESYVLRLRSDVEWLGPALHVYPKDGLFRVHAGPYKDQTEARVAADRISLALGLKPMVLTR